MVRIRDLRGRPGKRLESLEALKMANKKHLQRFNGEGYVARAKSPSLVVGVGEGHIQTPVDNVTLCFVLCKII